MQAPITTTTTTTTTTAGGKIMAPLGFVVCLLHRACSEDSLPVSRSAVLLRDPSCWQLSFHVQPCTPARLRSWRPAWFGGLGTWVHCKLCFVAAVVVAASHRLHSGRSQDHFGGARTCHRSLLSTVRAPTQPQSDPQRGSKKRIQQNT